MTAAESVEAIAAYCRAEQLVFALLGDGAARFTVPAAVAPTIAAADHAAWRARRWFEVLPTAPPGPDAFLVPTDADREIAAIARDHAVDEATLLAIVVVELLPRLRAAMQGHLDRTSPVADAPIRRLLDIALRDLDTDLAALLGAFETATASSTDRDRADRAAGAVAAIAARTGWLVGSSSGPEGTG